jgi:hypothetical protein
VSRNLGVRELAKSQERLVKTMSGANKSDEYLKILSCLTLSENAAEGAFAEVCGEQKMQAIAGYEPKDFEDLWGLANSHHVIMRALPKLHAVLQAQGNANAEWAEHAVKKEQARIENALSFLSPICEALRSAGDLIVIKALDHWPDLGNDLDLYSNAKSADIVAIMRDRFQAKPDERSWGDRLANKWNFIVPGLPELVEVHVGRLGQTGEQVAITESLVRRAGAAQLGSHSFVVPAAEDRIVISTLQRMYRHFYIRLCDILDNGRLMAAGAVDYLYLQELGRTAGLWDGLATYLVIVSEYVKSYGGEEISLPAFVKHAARFGNERVSFRRKFLRIPLFPQAAGLYVSEWERLLRNGELENTLRLSLLPGLAAAAAVELKLTGSDKGIW